MNYYEHHLGDYMRDAARLELVEEGAYRRLIDAYYVAEGPLPADRRECYKLAGAIKTAELKAVDYVLGKFFDETPDGFRHKRCDLEIARFRDKQNKAKASADARWNRQRTESVGNANASQTGEPEPMRTHSGGNAHQSPTTNHQSPDLKPNTEKPSNGIPSASTDEAALLPGKFAAELRGEGVSVTPTNPICQAWATDGFTLPDLLAAVEVARVHKPIPELIPAKYLDKVLRNPSNARGLSRTEKRARTSAGLGTKQPTQGATYDGTATRTD